MLDTLPVESRRQNMGRLIQSPDKKNLVPVGVQVQKALDDILDAFRSLCLHSYRDEATAAEPHRLLAWEEFKIMSPAIVAYAEELFAQNPYQETPLLRGIFFSSALRTDTERQSRAFPGLAGLLRGIFPIQENAAGFFLHDFFSRVLPADRNLNRPVAEYQRWRSSVRTVAYAALLLAAFGLAALFSLSFQHNERIVRRILTQAPLPPGDAAAPKRLLAYEQRFRESEQMEKDAGSGIFPSMGLNQRRTALEHFYRTLNEDFARDVFLPAISRLENQRSLLSDKSPDREFFTLAADLVWRFDLVSAVRQGKTFADLLKIPAMPQGLLEELKVDDFPLLYQPAAHTLARYYYNSRADAEAQEQALRSLRDSLSRLPEIKGYSLQWLIYRASELNNLTPLKGGVFWPGSMAGELDETQIDPAYTADGFKATLDYLDRLSLIIADNTLTLHAQDFLRWYAGSCAEAWKSFATAFSAKTLSLAGISAAEDAMTVMSSESNPFFAFALRMEEELRPVRAYLDPTPRWMEDLEVFNQALRLETSASKDHVQPSLTERIRHSARQFYEEAGSMLDADARERHARTELLVKEIQAYLATLRDLVGSTLSTDLSFSAVQEAMPDERNNSAATAKLTLATVAALSLRQKLNPAPERDSPLFILDNGPLGFFTARLINGASCHIQYLWEGNVLFRAGALSPIQIQQGLFAEQGGLARDFADNTLQYFLNSTLNGYEPQQLGSLSLPFTGDFLRFLNAGLLEYRPMPQTYAVTVEAVPVDVNDDALEMPYAAVLSLSCAQQKQVLANYNSPASMSFSWQRDGCGDTDLAIHFKSVTLNTRYKGSNGFVSFLRDFQYGAKTFQAHDFPGQEALLRKLGVTEITLRYTFSGAEAVLGGAEYAPDTLPFVAAECRR
jgi:type VI secretion system protein ImpL